MKFIGQFGFHSGRDIDKFERVDYKLGTTQGPIILENTTGFLEAQVTDKTPGWFRFDLITYRSAVLIRRNEV